MITRRSEARGAEHLDASLDAAAGARDGGRRRRRLVCSSSFPSSHETAKAERSVNLVLPSRTVMAATGNKIYLRKVGSSAGKVAAKPATFSELLAVATRKLDLAAPATRIFSTNGDEYEADDYGLIEKDEILYISCGSDFVPPAATQAASSVVAPIAAPVALSAVQNPVIAVPVTSATSSMPAPELEPVQVDLDQATLEQPVDAAKAAVAAAAAAAVPAHHRGGAASLQPSPRSSRSGRRAANHGAAR